METQLNKINIFLNRPLDSNFIEHIDNSGLTPKEKNDCINFLLVYYNCEISTQIDNQTPIHKIYKNIDEHERKIVMVQNLTQILQTFINDLSIEDMRYKNYDPNCWIAINITSLYNLKFPIINNDTLPKFRSMFKYKDLEQTLNISIIYDCLMRSADIFLYIKKENICINKNNIINPPKEISDYVKHTKGYEVLISHNLILKLNRMRYNRKVYKQTPTIIKYNGRTIRDLLMNCNYSSPIWIHNLDEYIKNDKNVKDLDNFINSNIVEILNFLNGTKFSINPTIFNRLEKIAKNSKMFYLNTNIENTKIYKYDKEQEYDTNFVEIDFIEDLNFNENNFEKFRQNTTIFELIKTQVTNIIKSGNFFYLTHKLDMRTREYIHEWPLNYQLNHIIRASIEINNTIDINILYTQLFSLDDFQYFKNNRIFLQDKIEKEDLAEIKKILYVNSNTWHNTIKIECFLNNGFKIVNKNLNSIDKAKTLIKSYKNFLTIDFNNTENIIKLKKSLNLNDADLVTIIPIQINMQNLINNKFSGMGWADASSNALQLITLKLGITDPFLLKITNIINNDTQFPNIYNYCKEKIIRKDKKAILQKITTNITEEEFNSLISDKLCKKIAMPSCYGMSPITNAKNINKMLQESTQNYIWMSLTKKEKYALANYLLKLIYEILKEVNFDLEKYKIFCNKQYKKNMAQFWINAADMPIYTVKLQKTKRQLLLKNNNTIKKELIYNKNKKNIKLKLQKNKIKIKEDERLFHRRVQLFFLNKKITIRLRKNPYIIDNLANKRGIIPNPIHAYDAAVLKIVIEYCIILNIKICVIHDSIGCQQNAIPAIKILFKLANIKILKEQKSLFPFTEPNNFSQNLFEEIMESDNFFK